MAHGITSRSTRLALGGALLLLAGVLFVLNPSSALAHHVTLAKSTTCNSYLIEADYFGGDGERYGEVRVNNVLVGTYTFLAYSGDHHNFYVNNPRQPYCARVIGPKMAKFERAFRDKLKAPA